MVAYQERSPTIISDKVKYTHCPSSKFLEIPQALFDGLDDEEMVYWCVDDKYPIELKVPKIERIYQWLTTQSKYNIDGLLFCRCRNMLVKEHINTNKDGIITDDCGNMYIERIDYQQIWVHQFIKVKVLRYLYKCLEESGAKKDFDPIKRRLIKPTSHHLYVTRKNYAIFGESTHKGKITQNCYESIKDVKLTLPSWAKETTKEIVMGHRFWV